MRITLQVFLHVILFPQIFSQLCDRRLSIKITEGDYINNKIVYNNITYNEDQYYEGISKNKTELYGCPCKIKKCYRKCCTKGKLLTTSCIESEKSNNYYNKIQVFDHRIPLNETVEELFIEVHDISCPSGQVIVLNPNKGHEVFLQKNGSLMYRVQGFEFWASPENFCMEMYDKEDFKELTALICVEKKIEDNTSTGVAYACCKYYFSEF